MTTCTTDPEVIKPLTDFNLTIDTEGFALTGSSPLEIYFIRGDNTEFNSSASVVDGTKARVAVDSTENTEAGIGTWKAEIRGTLSGEKFTSDTAKFEITGNFQ